MSTWDPSPHSCKSRDRYKGLFKDKWNTQSLSLLLPLALLQAVLGEANTHSLPGKPFPPLSHTQTYKQAFPFHPIQPPVSPSLCPHSSILPRQTLFLSFSCTQRNSSSMRQRAVKVRQGDTEEQGWGGAVDQQAGSQSSFLCPSKVCVLGCCLNWLYDSARRGYRKKSQRHPPR